MCAAVVLAVLGLWWLTRTGSSDATGLAMRPVAPPQLAAAVMLAAGGTIAAGLWQTARYSLRSEVATTGCGGGCAACTLACH